ncbi:uncharacterized protein MYCFIDRAFT_211301 [Pseudocercospora fijiensis CIRAD86]|uniref:Uncharacterized protein n=1 Tax=Pseudocercospora fijiensis (strain CIRAD86) TaxID=383855 RepID=M3B1N3_PSEFD|nr:uncharacterized protein MYCFIDRAFT_211301 [Pseudocercospora fijiensis CIRAD86]EME83322.1 hypothetical protein MYCFIDRAFT_211301 [Pseudocercospora fijiensis CIRAD86]
MHLARFHSQAFTYTCIGSTWPHQDSTSNNTLCEIPDQSLRRSSSDGGQSAFWQNAQLLPSTRPKAGLAQDRIAGRIEQPPLHMTSLRQTTHAKLHT